VGHPLDAPGPLELLPGVLNAAAAGEAIAPVVDDEVELLLPGRQPPSPASFAASIPARAQASSLSDVSPEIPTAPRMARPASRISTPPGTGTIRPSDRALSEAKNGCSWGCSATRRARARVPTPMPSAPQALPIAICGRTMPDAVLTRERLEMPARVEDGDRQGRAARPPRL